MTTTPRALASGRHERTKRLSPPATSSLSSVAWRSCVRHGLLLSELIDVNRRVPSYLCGTVNSTTWLAPGIGLCVASANSSLTLCGPGFNPTRTTVSPLVSTVGHDWSST